MVENIITNAIKKLTEDKKNISKFEKCSTKELISKIDSLSKDERLINDELSRRDDLPFGEYFSRSFPNLIYLIMVIAFLTIPLLIALGGYGYGDNDRFKGLIVTNLTSSNELIIDRFIGEKDDSILNRVFTICEENSFLFIIAYLFYLVFFIWEIVSLIKAAYKSIKKRYSKNGK